MKNIDKIMFLKNLHPFGCRLQLTLDNFVCRTRVNFDFLPFFEKNFE